MEMDNKNNATKNANYFLHANFYSKPRLIKKSSFSMATFEKESKLAITLDLYGGIIFLVLSYRSTKLFLKILIFALFSYSFSSKNPLKSQRNVIFNILLLQLAKFLNIAHSHSLKCSVKFRFNFALESLTAGNASIYKLI